jgi:DnaJ-domain-containing protein 1
VRDTIESALRRTLGRGELTWLAYRLGRQAASGVLTLTAALRGARPEVFVLRRGAVVCSDGDQGRRAVIGRLARLAGEPGLAATFDGGVTAYPPGALHQIALAEWARAHLEAQLDSALAERLVGELTGARLSLRAELAPFAVDDADRRMIAALAQPRRLDQVWSLARTPRFRLLAFLHFARAIGALVSEGASAEPPPRTAPPPGVRPSDPRLAALRLLGVEPAADAETIKRAYRRLARSLHPDLQPDADDARRRTLERRFAEVTAAYEALV